MLNFILNLFGDKTKFNELNLIVNENENSERLLNQRLLEKVNELERALNKHFGTRGLIKFFDINENRYRRVPPIHIEANYQDWKSFSKEKNINLMIFFNLKKKIHTEVFVAEYHEVDIDLKLGNFTTSDTHEFVCALEELVYDNLQAQNPK
ncbi:hypothetical protein [uncultured Shewanella sp.]|uniref:hypothetical protein n=1 Tax=uncultured Shewanella sp. TaxID=173975 RepID=UPI00262A3854|nr:hypothetical protein [uncultured Shewanella sp.]